MREKLTVPTMWIIQQLKEIKKHLRDCSEDIIAFSQFFADQLDWVDEPTMKPWDFVREWKAAVEKSGFELFSAFGGIDECKDPKGMHENIKAQVVLDRINKMMPIFAEDLCGKEFAEVAEMCREDGVGRIKPEPSAPISGCHPFPPGDPVLVEEGKRTIKSNTGLSEAEHAPAPPDAEFGNHMEAE